MGALKNLGYKVGRNTIKRILQEHGINPAPERGRRMSWATFIKAHLGVIVGMDFFTVEVVTWLGLIRYHVLSAIDIASRRVDRRDRVSAQDTIAKLDRRARVKGVASLSPEGTRLPVCRTRHILPG